MLDTSLFRTDPRILANSDGLPWHGWFSLAIEEFLGEGPFLRGDNLLAIEHPRPPATFREYQGCLWNQVTRADIGNRDRNVQRFLAAALPIRLHLKRGGFANHFHVPPRKTSALQFGPLFAIGGNPSGVGGHVAILAALAFSGIGAVFPLFVRVLNRHSGDRMAETVAGTAQLRLSKKFERWVA